MTERPDVAPKSRPVPTPPAHVQAYVDVLGLDDAIRFLLTFGGSELYLTATPGGRSRLAQMFGLEKTAALARAAEHLKHRVPTAKPWIAQVWAARGQTTAEIARALHVTDVTVRAWLKRGVQVGVEPGRDDRQMRLL